MKCPHCQVEINEAFKLEYIGQDPVADWFTKLMRCPNPVYNRFILQFAYGEKNIHTNPVISNEKNYFAISFDPYLQYEELANKDFYQDYLEAKSIQNISHKASILLSKDCLIKLLKIKIYSQNDNFEHILEDLRDQEKHPAFILVMIEAILAMNSEISKEFANTLINFIEGLFDYFYMLPNKMKVK